MCLERGTGFHVVKFQYVDLIFDETEQEYFDQLLRVEREATAKISLLNTELVKENEELRQKNARSQDSIESLQKDMSAKFQLELVYAYLLRLIHNTGQKKQSRRGADCLENK